MRLEELATGGIRGENSGLPLTLAVAALDKPGVCAALLPFAELIRFDLRLRWEIELGCEPLDGMPAQRLLDELTGPLALGTGKTLRLDRRLASGRDDHFNHPGGRHQAPPCTCTVSLIEPSERGCSVTACPCRRASIVARSTAYACKNLPNWARSPHLPP